MSSIKVSSNAAGTGIFTLTSPSTNTDRTITLPDASGTLLIDSTIAGSTAVSASGLTYVDFTGIPSGKKRIIVLVSGLSSNGTSNYQIQLGSGGITSSGYSQASNRTTSTSISTASATTGFVVQSILATAVVSGSISFENISSTIWVGSGQFADGTNGVVFSTAGSISLGGTLDRVRITTVNGTDSFDAGTINVFWE